jgi:CRISPR-associated protein Csb1
MDDVVNLSKNLDELFEGRDGKLCVAVVRKEKLMPVAGRESVIFPPTFAGEQNEGEKPDYVIDTTPDGNVVLLDSVESQANRMEKLFLPPDGPYRDIVPQIKVEVEKGDGSSSFINLIEAPHRIADALVVFSDLKEDAGKALLEIEERNNYTGVAKISPFSLLFGAWDSRGVSTGRVKIPRSLTSTVRGYNAIRLRRGYAYTPAVRLYMGQDEMEEKLGKSDGLSEVGMNQVPGTVAQGGVIVKGDIVRESVLSFVALRNIRAGMDKDEETRGLRRYIASLGLLCLVSPLPAEYRSGCALIQERGGETFELVFSDGTRLPAILSLSEAQELSTRAAREFLGEKPLEKQYKFIWDLAREKIDEAIKKKTKKR